MSSLADIGLGLCSALIKSYFEKADKEQANLYLEASSPKSRDIYASVLLLLDEVQCLTCQQSLGFRSARRGMPLLRSEFAGL